MEKTDKSRKILMIITIIIALFMIIISIYMYLNLSKPLYYNENGGDWLKVNVIDHFKSGCGAGLIIFFNFEVQPWMLLLPILSCVALIASIKFKWLSIVSIFLSFTFYIAAQPPGLVDIPKLVEPTGSLFYLMCIIGLGLCFARFVIAIIQWQRKIEITKKYIE